MKWIREKDVAAKLGVSLGYVRGLLRSDTTAPKPVRLSPRVIVYDEDEIEEWMRRVQQTSRRAEQVNE